MAIPKTIHYCWLGRNPKPNSVLKCIESWKKYCPDYEIIEWNEDNLDISSHLYSQQAYEAKAWAFATDYFRLWIVYHYGGIYLDTDVQIIKPLDPLLKNRAFMGFEDKTRINSGLGFGAEAGSQFIYEQMKVYDSLVFRNEDGTLNRRPAPEYLTEVASSFGLTSDTGKPQQILDAVCYPRAYFSPKDYSTGILHITRNTYTIHHYTATWKTEEEQAIRKRDRRIAALRYITYLPRSLAENLLGTKRYKRMVASIKSLLPKGKNK
ncbi:MAG: glycosyl transferase [Oscillospiraceae bacterium]|nr:glycosyl transferase [Oscillospiraceae bacterium]